MTMAFGTTRMRCGERPEYMLAHCALGQVSSKCAAGAGTNDGTHAFLLEHDPKGRHERSVLWLDGWWGRRLPHPGPDDFVRVRDGRCDHLCPARRDRLCPRRLLPTFGSRALRPAAPELESFVQRPLDRPLRDAEVAGREALVEAPEVFMLPDVDDTLPRAPERADVDAFARCAGGRGRQGPERGSKVLRNASTSRRQGRVERDRVASATMGLGELLLELQTRLDHPDRIGGRGSRDAGGGGGQQVDRGGVRREVEIGCEDVFAVAVGEKVDGPGGDDADEGRAQTAKEGAEAFMDVDIPASVA